MDIKISINNIKDLKESVIFRDNDNIVVMKDKTILIVRSLDNEILNQFNNIDEFTARKYNSILNKIDIQGNLNCDPDSDETDRYYGAFSTNINNVNLIMDIMREFNMYYIKIKSYDSVLEVTMWNKYEVTGIDICLIIFNDLV